MKTTRSKAKKLAFAGVLTLLMTATLSLGSLAASAASAITIPTFPDTYIMIEHRFLEGDSYNVPGSINEFGRQYNLVRQIGPVLEDTLDVERVYNWRIDGALSQAQFDQLKKSNPDLDIQSTVVDISSQREVNIEHPYGGLPNNDVASARIENPKEFEISSATSSTGKTTAKLELAGIRFEVETWEIPGELPDTYKAVATYRGIETFNEVGYTLINAKYQTRELDSEIDQFIVIAVYAPVGGDAPVNPPVIGPGAGGEVVEGEGEGEDIIVTPPPIDVIDDPEPPLTITDPEVPQDSGQDENDEKTVEPAGSILSTIFTILAIVVAALLLVAIARSRKEQYESAAAKSATTLLRALVFITSALTVVIWMMYDGVAQPAAFTNEGTLFVGIVLAVNVILFVIASLFKNKSVQASSTEREQYTA